MEQMHVGRTCGHKATGRIQLDHPHFVRRRHIMPFGDTGERLAGPRVSNPQGHMTIVLLNPLETLCEFWGRKDLPAFGQGCTESGGIGSATLQDG